MKTGILLRVFEIAANLGILMGDIALSLEKTLKSGNKDDLVRELKKTSEALRNIDDEITTFILLELEKEQE